MALIQKIKPDQTLSRLLKIQGKELSWSSYSIKRSQDEKLVSLAAVCTNQSEIMITYLSGQTLSQPRKITPLGIVRNPDGDYVHAYCHIDKKNKRFYINKIIF